jgi:hypothetical protein
MSTGSSMKPKRVVERWGGPGQKEGTIVTLEARENVAYFWKSRNYFEHW